MTQVLDPMMEKCAAQQVERVNRLTNVTIKMWCVPLDTLLLCPWTHGERREGSREGGRGWREERREEGKEIEEGGREGREGRREEGRETEQGNGKHV